MASFGFGSPNDPENIYDEEFFRKLEDHLIRGSVLPGDGMGYKAAWFAKEYREKKLADRNRNHPWQAPASFGLPNTVEDRRLTDLNPFNDIPRIFSDPTHTDRYEEACSRVIQRHAQEKAAPEENVRAFLKLIRYAETGKTDSTSYNILYGGGTFSSYKTHPLKEKIGKPGHKSTAAGAYQILRGTYEDAVANGVASDFSPESQDKIALDRINHRHAMDDIRRGNIERAIQKLNKEWSSLPGGSQSRMTMHQALAMFSQYLCYEMYGVKK